MWLCHHAAMLKGQMSLSSMNRHLIVVKEFVCFNDSRSYDVGASCSW